MSPQPRPPAETQSVGYGELLRNNPDYRRIWLGDIASLLGDWFNTIAVYTLVERLTGSPLALGLVFITKMLPFALASPVAGLLADRVNRRRLMIGADLVRAVVVLGLLLIREPGDMPLLYTLLALQMVVSAAFIPARSASIPNITTPRELLTANALSAATWSSLLALGAALGGFVTEWLGTDAVFLLDSATYLVSAAFIYRTRIPQATEPAPPGPLVRTAFREILRGWGHLRSHPEILRIALAKPLWGLGGGALVYMLALVGQELTPAAPALGIGWLYAARGLGTGLGPLLARRWLPSQERWPGAMGVFIVWSGVVYLVVGSLPWTWWLVLLVFLGHTTSGANWVLSTVLLQERTEDRLRGRVFSTEWLMLTLVDTAAILGSSLLLEAGHVDLRQGILLFAALQVLAGLLWLLAILPGERRARSALADG